jgi:outer membrane protein
MRGPLWCKLSTTAGGDALLAAVGRLSFVTSGLPVQIYDPTVHYHQVRDVWIGAPTPDER